VAGILVGNKYVFYVASTLDEKGGEFYVPSKARKNERALRYLLPRRLKKAENFTCPQKREKMSALSITLVPAAGSSDI
jgi:hypothetical protein